MRIGQWVVWFHLRTLCARNGLDLSTLIHWISTVLGWDYPDSEILDTRPPVSLCQPFTMRQIRISTNSDLRNLLWLLLLLSGVLISHVNDVYLRILSHRRFIFQVIMLWKKTKSEKTRTGPTRRHIKHESGKTTCHLYKRWFDLLPWSEPFEMRYYEGGIRGQM